MMAFGAALIASRARADEVPDEVKVHVKGDSDLVVERSIENTDLWESVCVGTCDRKLPLEGRYRLIGRGIRQSLPIALVRPKDQMLHLDVKAAYTTAWAGGITLVAIGATTLFAGVITFIAGATQNTSPPCFEGDCFGGSDPTTPQGHPATIAGAVMLGLGSLMTTAGIISIVLGSQTHIQEMSVITIRPTGVSFTF